MFNIKMMVGIIVLGQRLAESWPQRSHLGWVLNSSLENQAREIIEPDMEPKNSILFNFYIAADHMLFLSKICLKVQNKSLT